MGRSRHKKKEPGAGAEPVSFFNKASSGSKGQTPFFQAAQATGVVQRETLGTAFTHPPGVTSPYRRITATFNGSEFVLYGDRHVLMRISAQSGRPYSVRAADATACGGSTSESYLNNPRYVGIRDNGPIPEGEYQFRAASMATFGFSERMRMMGGGHYTDPFGDSLHGGDWGSGRVALNPVRILPGPRGCGNTAVRSGFYLHGGIMPGSSGCIDIGNSGVDTLVSLLQGYTGSITVRVRYTAPAPDVGFINRALGRFTYPPGENPSIRDRIGNIFSGE